MSQRHGKRCALGLAWASIGLMVLGFCPPALAQQDDALVSLETVLQHADTHAPLLMLARARLEEGTALEEGADRLLSAPLRADVGAGPRFAEGTGEDFDVLVSLMQPLEIAGERGLRQRAATRTSERLQAELVSATWQVHREVHFAFHEAIEARVREAAERRWVAFAERMVELATLREQAGEVGPLEAITARAELAFAMQRMTEAEHRWRASRLTLAEVSGWPAAHPPAPAGDLVAPIPIPEDAELMTLALANHPLLLERRAAIAEHEASSALLEREVTPNLDVGLSFAREGSAGSPANYIALFNLGMSIPVWNANTTERAQARARVSIAEAQLAALESVVQARVLRAAASARASAERVRIFEVDVLPGLERHLALLQRAFELGELDALTVATASRRLLEVQANALDAFAEYHQALAELEAEVGEEVLHREDRSTDDETDDATQEPDAHRGAQ